MDIEILREFMLFSRGEGLSKTARQLHISPSSLSRHIARMEADLGTRLFARKDPAKLTAAGEIALEEASHIVSIYDEMVRKIHVLEEGAANRIRIVYRQEDRAMSDVACMAKALIEKEHLQVDVELLTPRDSSMRSMVEGGEADVALMYRPSDLDEESLGSRVVFHDPLVIGANVRNPVERKAKYRLEDFSGSVFFYPLCKAFSDYYDYALRLFVDRGIDFSVRYVSIDTSDQYYTFDDDRRIWCFTKTSFQEGRSPMPSVAERRSVLCEVAEPGVNADRHAIFRRKNAPACLALVLEKLVEASRESSRQLDRGE
ncbi:LysR family transcriptional regulator [Arabiibacter massiliensis]|uniref:LysR family transcriptional regulator n=1 Tax=Arabiibacter massiliensis TaxID=1870985 RepID=UPI00155A937B|nr:LysR family transcriptional regulator [Arabiibacter massiliensis]